MFATKGERLIPKAIVVHCSASRWGDAKEIDKWHKGRGWSGIGYHAVILNGYRNSKLNYNLALDGKIEPGRKETQVGAHCQADGMNYKALGVCLIGMPGTTGYITPRQRSALVHYLTTKCKQYGISPDKITQHSDHDPGKPYCASLNMKSLREEVRAKLAGK